MIDFPLNEAHFSHFKSNLKIGEWPVVDTAKWLVRACLAPNAISPNWHGGDRDRLKEMARSCISSKELVWAILAWGRMDIRNGKLLIDSGKIDVIAELVERLRREDMSRSEAYGAFARLLKQTGPIGLGPAYFTKLIYFAAPRHDGYIMDQWTSRSVNLLSQTQPAQASLVRMNGRWASPANTPENYENYCRYVEMLAHRLKCDGVTLTAEEVEMGLFSKGGRKPDVWRKYIRADGREKAGNMSRLS